MKCGICESTTCKDCNEIIEDVDEHECNQEAVASMKLINKDTKPCPSCGTMIHKVSGCNQMWCPDCQNAFDWRTGNVERGVIHNPHYYQYMQNNPETAQRRNHGDFECGGMPNPMVTLWCISACGMCPQGLVLGEPTRPEEDGSLLSIIAATAHIFHN